MRSITLLFVLLFATTVSLNAQQQGICGKVVLTTGNQMPGPDRVSNVPQGIVREVYIFEATTLDQVISENGFFKKVNTKLLKKITTKKDGSFRISLPPSTYSIFIKEPDGLWANSFDGQGRINPIVVNTGEFTSVSINVNYQAAY